MARDGLGMEDIMRKLLTLLALFGFSNLALAATTSYDIYVMACDSGTDCLRVADVEIDRDGPSVEYSGPGFTLHIDTLAGNAEEAVVRLSVNLVPKGLAFASLGSRREASSAKLSFQIEPCTLKRSQYGFLGTFSGGNKIYQVWGRMMSKQPAGEVVASR